MTTLSQILAAFTDANEESLQAGYDSGDSNWSTPPTLMGSDY